MATEDRLEQVEKRVRRLSILAVALVAIAVGGFALSLVQVRGAPAGADHVGVDKVPGVIRAKRFEVVNDIGMSVVVFRSW